MMVFRNLQDVKVNTRGTWTYASVCRNLVPMAYLCTTHVPLVPQVQFWCLNHTSCCHPSPFLVVSGVSRCFVVKSPFSSILTFFGWVSPTGGHKHLHFNIYQLHLWQFILGSPAAGRHLVAFPSIAREGVVRVGNTWRCSNEESKYFVDNRDAVDIEWYFTWMYTI